MPVEATQSTETILDVIRETAHLSTFYSRLRITGLDETLQQDGPFTVFAPTNDAFANGMVFPFEQDFNANLDASRSSLAALRELLLPILKTPNYDGDVVHTIVNGETLDHIAGLYGTTVGAIRAANENLDDWESYQTKFDTLKIPSVAPGGIPNETPDSFSDQINNLSYQAHMLLLPAEQYRETVAYYIAPGRFDLNLLEGRFNLATLAPFYLPVGRMGDLITINMNAGLAEPVVNAANGILYTVDHTLYPLGGGSRWRPPSDQPFGSIYIP